MNARIRMATPDDAEQIHEIYAPYCNTPISFEAGPPGVAEMQVRLRKILVSYPWLVCEEDGRILGYAYASQHSERAAYRWSVNTTVYVQRERARAGMGRALYTALFEVLRMQGYVNAYAGITLPNPASIGLHESMGFEQVGIYRHVGFKYGTWHDVAWYALQLRVPPHEPEEAKKLDEVLTAEQLSTVLQKGLTQSS